MISDDEKQAMSDYMYQIIMRPGTTEYAIHLMFNADLHAHLPLGADDKLGSSTFPIPVSFYYGTKDWVLFVEENAGELCVNNNKRIHKNKSSYNMVEGSDHNLHMDNPEELGRFILQDLD
jgi:pimeloyl-ACP methyl ester carboxylesterase